MSTNLKNRRWVLINYPESMPEEKDFRLDIDLEVPELKENEVLVQASHLSVDPYMRGRISPTKGYTPGVELEGLMPAGGVGEIIESRSDLFEPGDKVFLANFGWQEFTVAEAGVVDKLDTDVAPIQSYLSYMGMPGLTAYFGLFDVANAKPRDNVVISAASGAVGQVVGQLAKAHGCRVVAVASSSQKIDWCKEIGYDEGINYKEVKSLSDEIKAICPGGVDVYFDNTGGQINDAIMENLSLNARIAVCGVISLADKIGKPDIGPRYLRQILIARARIQGFLVFDFIDRYPEAREHLIKLISGGEFKFKEDITIGIESMAASFIQLLNSENFGKKLIKI
ncbi:MAG: NADP-dependent oxidoreductase [Pseudomonadota bacterium]|nr:NADP-dependent oxidoreductase [Pseudomonadota bacterium]